MNCGHAVLRAFALIALFVASTLNCLAAGVTIVTHGLNSNIDGWALAMAQAMPKHSRFPGTNFLCYEIAVTNNPALAVSAIKLAGSAPSNNFSGEIFVKLDWRNLANNSFSTFDVATAVVPRLLQTNFIPELGGHALAELPIHLIGHSRGGSLICEMSRQLGTNGIWVDHLTTLDPRPLNNDGFSDAPFFTVVDAPCRTYENVLFHDNYFQRLDTLFFGETIAGSYSRRLLNLDGGYSGAAGAHFDVHLWYHGTIDLKTPTTDSEASLTSAERQTWWMTNELAGAMAGFHHSLLGGGNRLSTNRPGIPATASIRDGYNQRWNLGAGATNNRTALTLNGGIWPNLIKFNLTSTNVVAPGQSNSFVLYYQWARPASSNATLSFHLDDDFNPLNGNERLVQQQTVAGSTSNQAPALSISLNLGAANTTPGDHALYARISAGGRTRYLYAPEILRVLAPIQRPSLAITAGTGTPPRINVTGVAGQRLVLEASIDLVVWQSVATNVQTTNVWTYSDNSPASHRFYRARLE